MILIILTSHRQDCFSLCLKCLEQHTELAAFEQVYVLANDLEPGHQRVADMFAAGRGNVMVVNFSPRGFGPVTVALELVLRKHRDSIIVKLDEDVFVTEGWLQGLLHAYNRHRGEGCGLVSALVPNNNIGLQMLHGAYCEAFPEYAASGQLQKPSVAQNPEYAVWLWKNILTERMNFSPKGLLKNLEDQRITGFLNINCVLFSPAFTELLVPFADTTDEWKVNTVLQNPASPLHGVVTPGSVAHHYSFRLQQEAVDQCVSLPAVSGFFERQWGSAPHT